jgi:putative ABC transport system substrate-binding protein
MKRRRFLAGVAATLALPRALAQSRRVKIGMLGARPLNQSFYAPLVVRRLAELGYREGTTMVLEERSAGGVAERYAPLARELIEAKSELVFALGSEHSVRALQGVRSPVPIVFLAVDFDPLESGVVTSLSKPDRNTTGVYIPQAQLAAKRLEILREIVPQMRRVLVLSDPFCRDQMGQLRDTARALGVQLTIIEFERPPYDFAAAFDSALQAKVEGFIALASPVFANQSAEIGAQLARYKLPGSGWPLAIERMGALVGYSENSAKVARRTAEIGVRILKGAKPADIPIEQADEFVLAINAGVAKTLGLRVPESVMARATRIVQ